jgi:hypothetical protein
VTSYADYRPSLALVSARASPVGTGSPVSRVAARRYIARCVSAPAAVVSRATRRHDCYVVNTSVRLRVSVALAMTARHCCSNSVAPSGINAARISAGEASANDDPERPRRGRRVDAAIMAYTLAQILRGVVGCS